jgi:hypothetical protein
MAESSRSRSQLMAEYQRLAREAHEAHCRSMTMEREFLEKKVLNSAANAAIAEHDDKQAALNSFLARHHAELFTSETGKREHHSVWAVQNKTSVILFSTEQAAKDFVATFPASVSGGMEITQMGVV